MQGGSSPDACCSWWVARWEDGEPREVSKHPTLRCLAVRRPTTYKTCTTRCRPPMRPHGVHQRHKLPSCTPGRPQSAQHGSICPHDRSSSPALLGVVHCLERISEGADAHHLDPMMQLLPRPRRESKEELPKEAVAIATAAYGAAGGGGEFPCTHLYLEIH